MTSGEDSRNIISTFKKGYNDGTIVLSTHAFALSEEYENELYKKHIENIREFEKKYNIANERN
jgi:hypothetical protein